MNRDKIYHFSQGLSKSDIEVLDRAIAFCEKRAGEGFKELIASALVGSYDTGRKDRLLPVVKALDKEELLWLCDHFDEFQQKTNRSRGR